MKHHISRRIIIWLRTIFSGITIIFLTTSPVSALTDAQWSKNNANGINYWNPQGSETCTVPVGSYSGSVSAGLSEEQAGFVDTYHEIAEQLSVEYGIPWETVMAQGINESAAGTKGFAYRNNFFGLNAVDHDPNAAYDYETPEAGWRGYYEFIATNSNYRNHGAFQNDYTVTHTIKPNGNTRLVRDNITNPYDYLQTIWDAGYATSTTYYENIAPLIDAVINRANEKGWKLSTELFEEYPEMATNAATYASGSTPTAGSTNASYTGSACVTGYGTAGSGNGDVNQTAIALSWPDQSHQPTDPKPEYAQALIETGVNKLGDHCSMGGYSCDAFVATVYRYSGVDENFPCCTAIKQKNYLNSHPELYQRIGNAGSLNTSAMMPGDIRVSDSHIEIFVQLDDGSLRIASASHCDRTADHYQTFYMKATFDVYRKI